MKSLIVVVVLALLGTAVADLPSSDLDQIEATDASTYDAARSEEINAIPADEIDPEERERADVYSTAVHLSNHISFGGTSVHSEASPYASLFQVQETDSRRLAEKDMELDNMNIVPEERDDSQAPVIPFFASADMTEIADPLLDIASEHRADEEEDQALDHAADVLEEDVEAGDVAELAMSAPSLVEEEELPRVVPRDDAEAEFIEMMDDDEEVAEDDDDSSDEEDDESDDATEHDDSEEEDDVHTEEHDESFDNDDHVSESESPAANAEQANAPAAAEAEAPAAPADQADDAAAKNAEAPAALPATAPIPEGVAAPSGDVTASVQDQ